jgi:hypothetical protein
VAGRARGGVLLALLALAVLGCGGGASPSGPVATGGPSSSVPALGEAELAVCDGTVRMSEGVARIREIRLRRGAEARVASAFELVAEGQALVTDYAPLGMRTRARSLGFAVTNLSIAIEDLHTTDRVDAAVSNIKRRTTALRRSIEGFRTWVGCPEIAGADTTDDPEASATTDPSGPPVD